MQSILSEAFRKLWGSVRKAWYPLFTLRVGWICDKIKAKANTFQIKVNKTKVESKITKVCKSNCALLFCFGLCYYAAANAKPKNFHNLPFAEPNNTCNSKWFPNVCKLMVWYLYSRKGGVFFITDNKARAKLWFCFVLLLLFCPEHFFAKQRRSKTKP